MTEGNESSQTPVSQQVLHFLERVAAAEEPLAVLKAIQDYLLAWPKERVANLQTTDGGWAPFDRDQNPLPMNTLGHLELFQKEVQHQCLALSQANLQLTPEIVELNEVLTIAIQLVKAAGTPEFKELSAKLSKRTVISELR